MPMMTTQRPLDKHDAKKNAAHEAKMVWECDHCGRKFATRRGMSVHQARDADCNHRETEYRRSCQNFESLPNNANEPPR